VSVVALSGEHDYYSAPGLSKALAAELAEGRSVVVDLRAATFVDSTSAGALLVGDQRARAAGQRLVVLLPDDSAVAVLRLFETARLGSILSLAADYDAALELARSPLQSS
jgi:anti-anti-sigma factor